MLLKKANEVIYDIFFRFTVTNKKLFEAVDFIEFAYTLTADSRAIVKTDCSFPNPPIGNVPHTR